MSEIQGNKKKFIGKKNDEFDLIVIHYSFIQPTDINCVLKSSLWLLLTSSGYYYVYYV